MAAKLSSNGSKEAMCVRCGGTVQPYAGEAANTSSTRFAHHPGQCRDRHDHEALTRKTAERDGFAWSCRQLELGTLGGEPEICDAGGSDPAEYAAHMKAHGKRGPKAPEMIRLRKRTPPAKFPAAEVPVLKWLRWTEVKYGEWQAGIGNPVIGTADRRGQFWSEGPYPHSVWVIPFEPAPWEPTSRPPKPVTLFVVEPGRYTADWSEAKRERREVSRRERNRKAVTP